MWTGIHLQTHTHTHTSVSRQGHNGSRRHAPEVTMPTCALAVGLANHDDANEVELMVRVTVDATPTVSRRKESGVAYSQGDAAGSTDDHVMSVYDAPDSNTFTVAVDSPKELWDTLREEGNTDSWPAARVNRMDTGTVEERPPPSVATAQARTGLAQEDKGAEATEGVNAITPVPADTVKGKGANEAFRA